MNYRLILSWVLLFIGGPTGAWLFQAAYTDFELGNWAYSYLTTLVGGWLVILAIFGLLNIRDGN